MGDYRDVAREPCPDRIVEDLGGAYGMGCIGGFLWHFGKGFHNSPRRERLAGAFYSARMRSSILGGNFAVWGGTFSAFDCTFQYIRQRDDPWNAIASGAATGGMLALRGGWRSASRQAMIGGILLAVIEGVMVIFSRRTTTTPRDQYYEAVKLEEQMKRRAQAQQKAAPITSDALTSSESSYPSFSNNINTVLLDTPKNEELFTSVPNTRNLDTHDENIVSLSFPSFSSEYAPPAESVVKRKWRWFL